MMRFYVYLTTTVAALLLGCMACESANMKIPAASIQPREAIQLRSSNQTYEIQAKFLDFEMGDVEHYLFEDDQGNIIDFSAFENDSEFELKEALPPQAHNDFNKGWDSNPLFQDKWFLLKVSNRANTKVILNASLL